ncbi:hypothetical protein [Labrys neptuniae]
MNRFYLAALLALALVTSVFFHPLVGLVVFSVGVVTPLLPAYAWAGVVALFALVAPALAQIATDAASTAVSLPIGQWISDIGTVVLAIAGGLIAWIVRKLPAQIAQIITTAQVDQMLTKAIGYAINAVEGATAGKTLNVNVGNAVLAQALNYVTVHAPQWLIEWLGGLDAIAQKIIARLNLDPAAGVSSINGTPVITGSAPAAPSPAPAPAPAA